MNKKVDIFDEDFMRLIKLICDGLCDETSSPQELRCFICYVNEVYGLSMNEIKNYLSYYYYLNGYDNLKAFSRFDLVVSESGSSTLK